MAAGAGGPRGEGAGAHHRREVEEGRELLVGPLGAVVGLDRHQPAAGGVLGDQAAERVGREPRVGVEEEQVRAGGRLGADVAGPRLARPAAGGGGAATTVAPCAAATAAVASVEPSSTTITSWGAGSRARSEASSDGQRPLLVAGGHHDRHRRRSRHRRRGPARRRGVGMRARSSTPATRPSSRPRATCSTAQPRRSSGGPGGGATLHPGRHAGPVGEHVVVGRLDAVQDPRVQHAGRCARTGPRPAAAARCPSSADRYRRRQRSISNRISARHSGVDAPAGGVGVEALRSCCGR